MIEGGIKFSMKLLVVDDEEKIREVIKEYAIAYGYEVKEAENGEVALSFLKSENFDLIILDIMMPKMDGFSFLQEKRQRPPVIILSARKEEIDKLTGFELGIDDYMTKPFSPKELMARCKAVIGRTQRKQDIYQYHNLKVNFLSHEASIHGKILPLTKKEFDLLSYFIQNKNIAISREQLLDKIWDFSFYGDDRTVDTHIKMLRNHLGEYRNLIETVRGFGYKFKDNEKE